MDGYDESEIDPGAGPASHPSTLAALERARLGAEGAGGEEGDGEPRLLAARRPQTVFEASSDYARRQFSRELDLGPSTTRSYRERMQEETLKRERDAAVKSAEKLEAELVEKQGLGALAAVEASLQEDGVAAKRPRRRWDSEGAKVVDGASASAASSDGAVGGPGESSEAAREAVPAAPPPTTLAGKKRSRWDPEQPAPPAAAAVMAGVTAAAAGASLQSRLAGIAAGLGAATPLVPAGAGGRAMAMMMMTPAASAAAAAAAAAAAGMMTPMQQAALLSGGSAPLSTYEREIREKNKPWTEAELDALLPSEGYVIVEPPESYVARGPRASAGAGAPLMTPGGFFVSATPAGELRGAGGELEISAEAVAPSTSLAGGDLPEIRPEDMPYFGKLIDLVGRGGADGASLTTLGAGGAASASASAGLSAEEEVELDVLRALLRIKNGTSVQRRAGVRALTRRARAWGVDALLPPLLALLASPTLDEESRHHLVRALDRVLFQLQDAVRPYAEKMLVVSAPMLLDSDPVVRGEGREVITNLARAVGRSTMLQQLRKDVDDKEEFNRNVASRVLAVVAQALGVSELVPFLRAAAGSTKSWEARHTACKAVHQIALLLRAAVLPDLKGLVAVVTPALADADAKVRTVAAMAVAALAEASFPHGFEMFEQTVVEVHRMVVDVTRRASLGTRALAAFLHAAGALIALMPPKHASWMAQQVLPGALAQASQQDEEMRRVVLVVVKQCVETEGLAPEYIRESVAGELFAKFWVRRSALDHRTARHVVDTTLAIAKRIGSAAVLEIISPDLRDDSEPYRRMVVDAVRQILLQVGAADISTGLEEKLLDGAIYAFQEQGALSAAAEDEAAADGGGGGAAGDSILGDSTRALPGAAASTHKNATAVLEGFGTVLQVLNTRCSPYMDQIVAIIKQRIKSRSSAIRMQAADLVEFVAPVMMACDKEPMLLQLGEVLSEALGEAYPDVLGSVLGALGHIAEVVGLDKLRPDVDDLVKRISPILRNPHEKVQEECVRLLGHMASRGARYVSPKEWMRAAYDTLELLHSPRRSIRRAAITAFGALARAVGPQDVVHVLLNNLRVPERTARVASVIAIAVVAHECQPFTVLPHLMNEYRVADVNVRNGVLKALAYLFQYIGDQASNYAWAVMPLLEDALTDRDPVHRQTACFAVKHLALGLQGAGKERGLVSLLNAVLPNMLGHERVHLMQGCFEALEGLRTSLGAHVLLQYALQGLFHPARRVRHQYWRLYNNLAVYSADALVPVFPHVCDDLVDLPPALARQYALEEDPSRSDWLRARAAARSGTHFVAAVPALTLRPARPADSVAITGSAAPSDSFLAAARTLASAAAGSDHADGATATARQILRLLDAHPLGAGGRPVRRVRNRYTQTYLQVLF